MRYGINLLIISCIHIFFFVILQIEVYLEILHLKL